MPPQPPEELLGSASDWDDFLGTFSPLGDLLYVDLAAPPADIYDDRYNASSTRTVAMPQVRTGYEQFTTHKFIIDGTDHELLITALSGNAMLVGIDFVIPAATDGKKIYCPMLVQFADAAGATRYTVSDLLRAGQKFDDFIKFHGNQSPRISQITPKEEEEYKAEYRKYGLFTEAFIEAFNWLNAANNDPQAKQKKDVLESMQHPPLAPGRNVWAWMQRVDTELQRLRRPSPPAAAARGSSRKRKLPS
jgi:hypothetical protein